MEPRAFEGIAVRAGMFALWNLTSTEHRDQVYRSFCAAMQSALDAKDFETASAFRDLREMLTENYIGDPCRNGCKIKKAVREFMTGGHIPATESDE